MSAGDGADPLVEVWQAWRLALAPLGIRLGPDTLALWRDLQGHGAAPFTGSGEFRPEVTRRLVEAVALIRASTADEPEPGR